MPEKELWLLVLKTLAIICYSVGKNVEVKEVWCKMLTDAVGKVEKEGVTRA